MMVHRLTSGGSFYLSDNVWTILPLISCLISSLRGDIALSVCVENGAASTSIPLNCSSNQMIHVISELYGERTTDDDCSVKTVNSYSKLYTDDSNALIVNCNGEETCTESTACSPCNASRPASEVTYECISESMNICSPLHQTDPLTSLYLHSPGFPDNSQTTGYCECVVSGSSLDVLVLQYSPGQRSGGLMIYTHDNVTRTWTSPIYIINRDVLSDVSMVLIMTNNFVGNLNYWVKIQGNIKDLSCSGTLMSVSSSQTTTAPPPPPTTTTAPPTTTTLLPPKPPLPPPPPTPPPPTPTPTPTPTQISTAESSSPTVTMVTTVIVVPSDNSTMVTVSAVLGVIVFLLLVVIVLLVLYFTVVKPQRRTKNDTEIRGVDNSVVEDDPTETNDARNTYSDLVRYENGENSYGSLHLYANP